MKSNEKFIFLEHTADIKFQAFGKSVEEVFKNSALAVANAMFKGKVKSEKTKIVNVEGQDKEALLYNFLDEISYLFDAENFLLSQVKNLKITENEVSYQLECELIGDNAGNYKVREHIKSVTYHDMFVRIKGKKWTAQVVLDV